ncbi:MAG: hypothetical protein JRN62_01635 [Nitrososphaerota archaeon]|jgi:hypothetical protein|nr:hypothetical protein [Nitrososphaerota archaeon]
MRPFPGVVAEVVALSVVLASARAVPAGPPFAVYIIVAQLLSTYLIHCPAHYLLGNFAGIRFGEIRFRRTSLARAFPTKARRFVGLLPTLSLSTEKPSMAQASRRGIAAMYAAGAVASMGSALLIAVAATLAEPVPYSVPAWAIALGYLLFDILFSPRSGDLMRSKRALKGLSPPIRGPEASNLGASTTGV